MVCEVLGVARSGLAVKQARDAGWPDGRRARMAACADAASHWPRGTVHFEHFKAPEQPKRSPGMGIGVLPVYSALDGLADGSFVRVLPRFTLQKMNIYVLHPSRKFTDARIKTWIELLKQFMPTATARDCLAVDDYGVPPASGN